jgi:hypothetical protein
MKDLTKIIASIVAVLTVLLQTATVQQFLASVLASHPNLSAIVAGLAAILALFHQPEKPSAS